MNYDEKFSYYCPICGAEGFPIDRYTVNCLIHNIPYIKANNDDNYYYNIKNQYKEKGIEKDLYELLFDEEIFQNPLFDENEYRKRIETERSDAIFENVKKQLKANLPKCPMCQSANIKKLSFTKRAVYGAAFGLFSKTARSQWECKNCGNKW